MSIKLLRDNRKIREDCIEMEEVDDLYDSHLPITRFEVVVDRFRVSFDGEAVYHSWVDSRVPKEPSVKKV